MSPPTDLPVFSSTELLSFAERLLTAAGLAGERAVVVAEVLLEGDLLGRTTHGLALLPAYLKAILEGTMSPQGEPECLADHGSAITWDGGYLPGPWLVRQAIALACSRVTAHPTVTVLIRRSHHIGCLQAYLKAVTDAGLLILLTCSDPNSSTVAPHGGLVPRYSPNPIAAGIPTEGDPLLMDISTSATANGLCLRKAATGERLPGPWLLDQHGHVTDDAQVIHQGGSILPLGGLDLGYKGFALGLLVEALTNALSGHGRADKVNRWGASVFLQVLNPDAFGGRKNLLRETTHLARLCRATPVPEGSPSVRLPGEAALARRRRQLEHGAELHPTILPALTSWAERLKVPLPSPRH